MKLKFASKLLSTYLPRSKALHFDSIASSHISRCFICFFQILLLQRARQGMDGSLISGYVLEDQIFHPTSILKSSIFSTSVITKVTSSQGANMQPVYIQIFPCSATFYLQSQTWARVYPDSIQGCSGGYPTRVISYSRIPRKGAR